MKREIHNPHDKGYKYILSIKRLFVELLRSFVDQGWAQNIKPEDVDKKEAAKLNTINLLHLSIAKFR